MLKNKRIVHISPVFQTKDQYNFEGLVNGGGGRYVSELALSMSRSNDTTLITFGESDYEFKYKTLNVRIVKCAPFLKRFNGDANFLCFRLFNILRDFDIIHAYQYYADTTLFACLFGIFTKKKVFVTDLGFRGINVSRYIPMKHFCAKVLVLTAYEKHVLKLSDNKHGVIHGGVDLEKYAYCATKKKQVMFIGRLLPHKGINYLIESLDPGVECIIAGRKCDDIFFDFLKKAAKGKEVKFLLFASDEEIINHLKESSVFVLPSVDTDVYGVRHKNAELFGLVIAEAFACGTPVIVTDSSALPYVVDDGVNGFVVAQNDPDALREKITFLFENPQEVARMGKNGRSKVEKIYNWESVSRLCMESYSEYFNS
jgi:glycosyltransferase involved in cell wall biosynthesis